MITKYGTSVEEISKTAADRNQIPDRRFADTVKVQAIKDEEPKKRPVEKEHI